MPVSPSTLQSETSRRNGALSHGPVTEAGKAASAQNAVRHGLRGGGISVRPEESTWYADLLATHLQLYVPANEAEKSVVEQLCIVELKLHRLDLLELAALDGAAEDEGNRKKPSLATLARYRNRIVKERWELEHRLNQLQHRRKTLGANAAGARQELRDEARARALGSIAVMGVLGSGLLSATNENGTNGPEPRGTNRQKSTDEPEAGDAAVPNRRQRRLMEKLARRKAGHARAA